MVNWRKSAIWAVPALSMALLLGGCSKATEESAEDTAAMATNDAARTMDQMGSEGAEAMLTSKVKGALAADTTVGSLSIDVETVGDTVTLTGTVETEAQKAEAERIAQTTEGVNVVVNNLTVGGM